VQQQSSSQSSQPVKKEPAKVRDYGSKAANMAAWAKANPTLAGRLKSSSAGRSVDQPAASAAPTPKPQPTTGVRRSAMDIGTRGLTKVQRNNQSLANKRKSKSTPVGDLKGTNLGAALAGVKRGDGIPESYDIVLEYLLSGGHAETVEEAHYIMMEMDQNTIKNICEGTQKG